MRCIGVFGVTWGVKAGRRRGRVGGSGIVTVGEKFRAPSQLLRVRENAFWRHLRSGHVVPPTGPDFVVLASERFAVWSGHRPSYYGIERMPSSGS